MLAGGLAIQALLRGDDSEEALAGAMLIASIPYLIRKGLFKE